MSVRKLATIQKVESVEPIPGADRIVKIKVLGWQLVAKKDDFIPGSLCVYCEVDSVLPERPEFEFLREKKFRIKTIRMKGVVSQGIAFPLEILNEYDWMCIKDQYYNRKNEHIIGTDVTEKLGIIKYELPLPPGNSGNVKGTFPKHIVPETDEIRVQSIPKILEEIRGKKVVATEKADGTSYTGLHWESEVRVCSRHQELKEGDEDVYWRITHKLGIADKLKKYYTDHGVNLAIQGEICGKGINKNRLGLKEDELFVFNVWNIDEQRYYDFEDFQNICQELELKTVRILCFHDDLNYTIEELVERVKGKYPGTNNNREGAVIRPVIESHSETIANYSPELRGRMSFKVINVEYQLKEEQ